MLKATEKCIRCGVCVQACPGGIIKLEQTGPRMLFPQMCINCGHCVAICPEGALDHIMSPLAKQVPIEKFPAIDALVAEQFLRSRRSIRCYKENPVPQDILLRLLDIARYAPSAANTQGLSYVVVTNRELMGKITAATVNWMESLLKTKADWVKPYAGMVAAYKKTKRDIILRGAPHLIVAAAPKELGMASWSARYALEYAELFAPTLGLGTCWAGFIELFASSGNGELQRLLAIDSGNAICGAIMAGYPRFTYKRLPDRNPLQVEWR